jgi:hypothetical protein
VAIKETQNKPEIIRSVKDMYKNFNWCHMEATGEIKSKGETKKIAGHHAVSYSDFLLRARPDLSCVLGIYVNEEGFRLSFSNACGIAHMKLLEWKHDSAGAILCAWMSRLYNPFSIKDTTRVISKDGVTFQLRYGDRMFTGCRLKNTGTAFGKRTTIFEVPTRNVLIKDQYIVPGRRFTEVGILGKVHEKVDFPGVVRIELPTARKSKVETKTKSEVEQVIASQDKKVSREGVEDKIETETRQKTRLMLLDIAAPLMDAKTPQDALIVIYDLLEGKLLCSHVICILTASSNSVLVQETVNFASGYQRWQCYD